MSSQSLHPDTTLVVRNVQSLANHQNQQKRGPLGNSQLPPAKRSVSVPAGKSDTSQGGSSLPSTIQGQNSTPLSSLNNSRVADITQRVASTPPTTLRRSLNTPTAMPGTSSRSTPAHGGTLQIDSTRRVVSSPASGIASTPTPLSSLESLPTPIPNPEAHAIITNSLRTRATERNQRQRQWQVQTHAVSTSRSMVSGSRSIHRFGHSDMTRLVFATGRLLELYMCNRRPFTSASDLEMVSYATRRVAKALAEGPHWQIIETYWNTTMQQNNMWSIAFEARTKEILKEVCWINGPRWILHAQTSTRFEHKSIRFNPIFFNQQGTTWQSFMISTGLNLPQSVCNSLIPFWQTISIFFRSQSVCKVVYAVQIQCRECRTQLMNG